MCVCVCVCVCVCYILYIYIKYIYIYIYIESRHPGTFTAQILKSTIYSDTIYSYIENTFFIFCILTGASSADVCPFAAATENTFYREYNSSYIEHILSIENTFYRQRTHSIENTF